jgi:hypothetical protein
MIVAVEAVSLSSGGRADEALKLLSTVEAENPNPQLRYFHALLDKQSGHEVAAIEGFANALISSQEAQAFESFAFKEDEPLPQLVRLYLALDNPRAALKLAERAPGLRPEESKQDELAAKPSESARDDESAKDDENARDDENVEEDRGADDGLAAMPAQVAAAGSPKSVHDERHAYRTLDALAEERRAQARVSLLGLLSEAAEQIGDLDRALKMARSRLALLPPGELKEAATLRLEHLLALQKARAGAQDGSFKVDQKLVALR